MCFFYNANPKSSDGISPAHSFFSRHFRFPFEKTCKEEIENASADFLVGDHAYVKPHPTKHFWRTFQNLNYW